MSRPSPGGPPTTLPACRHGGRPGSFDESARRLTHEELAVARALVREGHDVRSQAERRGTRTGDLIVCGTEVEVKSFLPPHLRPNPISAQSVANKFVGAKGQGAVAVIWAKGSGLSASIARAGFALFADAVEREGAGSLRAARIIGDGYDMSFALRPHIALQRDAAMRAHRQQARKQAGPRARPGGAPKTSL